MKLQSKFPDLDKVKHSCSHLTDIEFSNIDVDSGISILIETENLILHIYEDIAV